MDVHRGNNSAIVSADVLQRVQLLRAEEARLLLRRQDPRMKIQLSTGEQSSILHGAPFTVALLFQYYFL